MQQERPSLLKIQILLKEDNKIFRRYQLLQPDKRDTDPQKWSELLQCEGAEL